MQAVMVSQKPLFCENIANGKKTILITKTKPSIKTPFKGYIYCTKAKTLGDIILCKGEENSELFGYSSVVGINKGFAENEDINLKGMVICEFVCDCITPLYNVCTDEWRLLRGGFHEIEKQLVGMACLTEEELHEYANGKYCYAWHISELEIYDKPKELSKFFTADKEAIRHCENREQNYFAFTDTGYIKNGFVCKKHYDEFCFRCKTKPLSSPPSPWCYIAWRYIEGVNEDD